MIHTTTGRTLFVTIVAVVSRFCWIIETSFLFLHPVECFVYHHEAPLKVVPRQLQQQQGRYRRRPALVMEDIVTVTPTYLRSNPELTGVEEGRNDLVSNNNDDEDNFFRTLDTIIPNRVLYVIRDSGLLRSLANLAVLFGIPSLARKYPSALGDLLRLLGKESLLSFLSNIGPLSQLVSSTSSLLTVGVRHERLVYGNHPSQFVQMVHPAISSQQQHDGSDPSSSNHNNNKVVIFVHGGAWGSGFPLMYLLAITPFINMGYTCCVVGYRTYPDAGCIEQAQDVVKAIHHIQTTMKVQQQDEENEYDCTLLSHSSGTHICSLAFVKGLFSAPPSQSTTWAEQQQRRYSTTGRINRYIALAGVFDIRKHYQFEQRRGVARFSPMAPACSSGGGRAISYEENYNYGGQQQQQRRRRRRRDGGELLGAWRDNSPLFCLETMTTMSMVEDDQPSYSFPPECIFLHGALDTTCPSNYTKEFGHALQKNKMMSSRLLQQNEDAEEKGSASRSSTMSSSSPSSSLPQTVHIEILPTVEHAGMVLELMFGGPTLDVVLRCLGNTTSTTSTSMATEPSTLSKLS